MKVQVDQSNMRTNNLHDLVMILLALYPSTDGRSCHQHSFARSMVTLDTSLEELRRYGKINNVWFLLHVARSTKPLFLMLLKFDNIWPIYHSFKLLQPLLNGWQTFFWCGWKSCTYTQNVTCPNRYHHITSKKRCELYSTDTTCERNTSTNNIPLHYIISLEVKPSPDHNKLGKDSRALNGSQEDQLTCMKPSCPSYVLAPGGFTL